MHFFKSRLRCILLGCVFLMVLGVSGCRLIGSSWQSDANVGTSQTLAKVGSVYGIVTSLREFTDAPPASSPIANINIFLFDRDFKGSTENSASNSRMIVASATTDDKGQYVINNVPEGNYSVIPQSNYDPLEFSVATNSDSNIISVTNERRHFNVNFVTPVSIGGGTGGGDSGRFYFTINSINLPEESVEFRRRKSFTITVDRLLYYGPIPVPIYQDLQYFEHPENSVNFDVFFGFTGLLMTLSNNLVFHCRTDERNGQLDQKYVFISEFTCYYNLPLSGCPNSLVFEIDWKNKTVRKTN